MIESNIVKTNLLNRPVVESGQYTLALLQDACQAGIIDQEMVIRTHNHILNLLKDTIIKYTRGESTSVRAETAQSLLESLLYAIDASTASFADPGAAIDALKKDGVEACYKHGFELVTAYIEESRILYQNVKASKLVMGTHAYNLTIDDLAGFFNNYEPQFKAQGTAASIDYPLLFDDMSITGVFYIKNYLETLTMENYFCQLFATSALAKLLLRYGQVYAIDYRDTLLNIFEVVLTNAILSVLAGNEALELSISQPQLELLQQRLKGASSDDCSKLINQANEALISVLPPLQPSGLKDYMRKFIPVLIPRFWSGLHNDSLQNVMIVDQAISRHPDIILNQGRRMDDEIFRTLVEQLIDCASPAAKAALISSSVQSIEDFIDVLESECLFEDEFAVLYETLGDLELSILARIVFIEEVRTAGSSFELAKVLEQSKELEWQNAYVQFLKDLTPIRLDAIQNLVYSI